MTLRAPCDVVDDIIAMKDTFSGPIFWWSCHIWYQIEVMFYVFKFSKWSPFWGRDKLFTGSDTGKWLYQQDYHEHFQDIELLMGALDEIIIC